MKILNTFLLLIILTSCNPDTDNTQNEKEPEKQEIIKDVDEWKDDEGNHEGSFEEQFP